MRLFNVLLQAREAPHSPAEGFFHGRHLLRARSRDQRYEDGAMSATCCLGGSFYFVEESKKRLVQFGASALEFVYFSGEEASTKGKETDAELSVERVSVQRGGCEVRQRQRNLLVPQLLTNPAENLIAFVDRNEGSRGRGDTKDLSFFYVLKRLLKLSFLDELGDDDVAGIHQDAVLNKKAAAADGRGHPLKKRGTLPGGRRFTEHLRCGNSFLVSDRRADPCGSQLHTSGFWGNLPSPSQILRRICSLRSNASRRQSRAEPLA